MLLMLVLYLIYDVVDVGAFCDFFVYHSLLPMSSQDSFFSFKTLLFVLRVSEACSMVLCIFCSVLVCTVVDFQMLVRL